MRSMPRCFVKPRILTIRECSLSDASAGRVSIHPIFGHEAECRSTTLTRNAFGLTVARASSEIVFSIAWNNVSASPGRALRAFPALLTGGPEIVPLAGLAAEVIQWRAQDEPFIRALTHASSRPPNVVALTSSRNGVFGSMLEVQPPGQEQDEHDYEDDAADPGWRIPVVMVAPVGQPTEDQNQQDNQKQ